MPTIHENLEYWSRYDWSQGGEEWTVAGYGGPEQAWNYAILPRLRAFLPARHVLEIAPGYGVWTRFLREHAKRMTLVDLTPRCIEACRERFGPVRMAYHVNDGRSLDMVEDGSVDLVFSWHSLVHCQHEVMRAYVTQLGRKLRPGGVGLIHHSNFGVHVDPRTGQLTRKSVGWRGEDMTADKFANDAHAAGLAILTQEITSWGEDPDADCFSTFMKPVPGKALPFYPVRRSRELFWDSVGMAMKMDRAYPSGPGRAGWRGDLARVVERGVTASWFTPKTRRVGGGAGSGVASGG